MKSSTVFWTGQRGRGIVASSSTAIVVSPASNRKSASNPRAGTSEMVSQGMISDGTVLGRLKVPRARARTSYGGQLRDVWLSWRVRRTAVAMPQTQQKEESRG